MFISKFISSILFASKKGTKNIHKLCKRYKKIHIKQQTQVIYLGCVLDKWMSGEPLALKVVDK